MWYDIYMYHFLINPAARGGKGADTWKKVESELVRRGVSYEKTLSRSSEHIREYVGQLTTQPDIRLVVLGGDGTLNEVVDSISDFRNVRFGLIPTGSGDDFARDLGMSKEPLVLLDTILRDEIVRRLDIGTLTYADDQTSRRFAVSSDIGFGAAVCEGVNRSKWKKVLGLVGLAPLSYLLIALGIIFGTPRLSCDLILDDEKKIHLNSMMMTAAMIHRYEGGGFMFAPDADASDGRFDLCIAGNITVPKFLLALPKARKGTHFGIEGVDHYLAKKLEVYVAEPMWIHTDGEVKRKSDHVTFTCEQGVLNMFD